MNKIQAFIKKAIKENGIIGIIGLFLMYTLMGIAFFIMIAAIYIGIWG